MYSFFYIDLDIHVPRVFIKKRTHFTNEIHEGIHVRQLRSKLISTNIRTVRVSSIEGGRPCPSQMYRLVNVSLRTHTVIDQTLSRPALWKKKKQKR